MYPVLSLLAPRQASNFFFVAVVLFVLNSLVHLGFSIYAKSFNDATLSVVAIVVGGFVAYYYNTEIRLAAPMVRAGLFKRITTHEHWFNRNWDKNEKDFEKALTGQMKKNTNFGVGWLYTTQEGRPPAQELKKMLLEKRASEFRKTRGLDDKIQDLRKVARLRTKQMTSEERRREIQDLRSKNPTFAQQLCGDEKTCVDLAKGSGDPMRWIK